MKSFKQPKNFLSKRKKYVRQRDKGIIDGKTREVWKKLADKNKHNFGDVVDLQALSRKHQKSAFLARKRREEKDRIRRESLETIEFVDAIISSIKTRVREDENE